MGIEWDMVGAGYRTGQPQPPAGQLDTVNRGRQEQQRKYMDELTVGFCEHLHRANGFVTEIAAGHVISIGRESDVTGMPPSIRHTATWAAHR